MTWITRILVPNTSPGATATILASSSSVTPCTCLIVMLTYDLADQNETASARVWKDTRRSWRMEGRVSRLKTGSGGGGEGEVRARFFGIFCCHRNKKKIKKVDPCSNREVISTRDTTMVSMIAAIVRKMQE